MSEHWTSEQFLDYLEGLTDDFTILQIRETLTERGLCIAPAPSRLEPSAEAVARTICLSYGRDPDELTSWLEMCDANNHPVPTWRVYEEQAEAVLAAHHLVAPPVRSAATSDAPTKAFCRHCHDEVSTIQCCEACGGELEPHLIAAPIPSTAMTAEPVAWQSRFKGRDWEQVYDPTPDHLDRLKKAGRKIRALCIYAAPPSSGNADAVRGCLQGIIDAKPPKPEGRREPDDHDWEVQALEFQRIAKLALAALSSAPVAGEDVLRKIHYALTKDSLCDAERVASARTIVSAAISRNERGTSQLDTGDGI